MATSLLTAGEDDDDGPWLAVEAASRVPWPVVRWLAMRSGPCRAVCGVCTTTRLAEAGVSCVSPGTAATMATGEPGEGGDCGDVDGVAGGDKKAR